MAPTNEELVQRYQAGDKTALDELFRQCEDFLSHFAKKWSQKCNRQDLSDDIFIGASMALIEAANKYDPKKKSKDNKTASFLTFAYEAMVWAAMEVTQKNNAVIFSRYALNKYAKVCKEFKQHPEMSQDEAIRATAQKLKISEKTVKECLEYASLLYADSLEDRVFDDGNEDRKSKIAEDKVQDAERELLDKEQEKQMREILLTLSVKQEEVMRRRCGFVDGEVQSYERIAEEMGIPVETVKMIERRALKRLRKPERADPLRKNDE